MEIQGIEILYKDIEEKGIAKITKFNLTERDLLLANMRAVRDGGWLFYCYPGTYCRLHLNGDLVMSDTHMEKQSNRDFIHKANGRVLIAGLGLGLIIHNILSKDNITEIIVIEKYQEVIDLVSPKFNDPRLKYICADINEWTPNRSEKFDTIYFDIWPSASTDNLDEIKILHNKFKFYVNRQNPDHFMNSWMKKYLQNEKRKEARSSWRW